MKRVLVTIVAFALFTAFTACGDNSTKEVKGTETGKVVNVYTHRHYEPDQNIFKMFEEQTGIKVKVINASADELIQKMKMEGKQSPADVLITVVAGRLSRAKEQGLLQSIP